MAGLSRIVRSGQKLGDQPAFAKVITDAEKLASEPMPEMTAEIYAEYSRTGQRTQHYAKVRGGRYDRLTLFTLAECIENKGRFIDPLRKAIDSICQEPTWVYNFHDPKLENWKGTAHFVDLGAIVPAHAMAEILFLLRDRLDQPTHDRIVENLRRRILQPYKAVVDGAGPPFWWITAEMNWNAVCHAGVIGTALGACDDPREKAFYVAAAEKYMHRYLAGFGPDGLCAEGMGYWAYGYGNFTVLAEEVWQASGGKINFYDLRGARLDALYPVRLEIINDVRPSFADGAPNPTPDARLLRFLNRRYDFGLSQYPGDDLTARTGALPETLMFSSPSSATTQPATSGHDFYELRSYFDHGGVLICRPNEASLAKNSGGTLGVAIKGGYNDEPHNHNDLGTFVTVVGHTALILDPGGEVYTARTFSKRRYDSNLINSFGHPVPIVAGQLQKFGADAIAKITSTHFSDAADELTMNITSAYPVPQLKKLTRSFVFSREGSGSLKVTDEVAFTSPESFAGALITYNQWRQLPDGSIGISNGPDAVKVQVDTGGVPFDVKGETINEDSEAKDHAKPTHIAINLREPVTNAKVSLLITPLSGNVK